MLPIAILAGCTPEPTEFNADEYADIEACTETGVAVGQCAPDFTLTDADSAEQSLSALRGSVTMVDFSGFS